MGADKALLEVDGMALLDRAIAAVARVSEEVKLACGEHARYEDRGLALVLDEVSGVGPLEGLRVALAGARTPRVLFHACDLAVDPAHIDTLLASATPEDQVVCYETGAGPEPHLALIHVSALDAIEAALARSERRMIAFWNDVQVRRLSADASAFCNVNTPRDLDRARRAQ